MANTVVRLLYCEGKILDLADRVGLWPPPCLRRVYLLREPGVVTHDVSLVDPQKAGKGFIVFLNVSLERQREDLLENFEWKVMSHREVM